jgi:nucleoside-diphosphate-sugar epimerase
MIIGVTGANGFIGKNLVQLAETNGHAVVAFPGDVTNSKSVWRFFDRQQCDAIVHLAGKNRAEPEKILDVNVLGTYNLASVALALKIPLIVAGSDNWDGHYGASKRIARSIIKKFNTLDLKGIYCNIPRVFGPHAKPFYNSFVSTILWSVANNKPFKHLVQNPKEKLELIHVDTLCERLLALAGQPLSYEEYELQLSGEYYFSSASLFKLTIQDIVDIAESGENKHHLRGAKEILSTLEWYKQDANNQSA